MAVAPPPNGWPAIKLEGPLVLAVAGVHNRETMLMTTEQLQETKVRGNVRLIHIVLLACIVLVAALMRVHALGRTSYWNDEICSVLYARGQTAAIFSTPQGYFDHAPAIASAPGTKPLLEVWTHFDSNPPLYATVLRLWWRCVGESDVSGRALSVVLSLAMIVALFDFGRILATPAVALWACALCAASPAQVHYAQEARPYALVGFLGVMVCDIALRITRYGASWRRYVLLWFFCAAALLTHFFIVGAIASIAIYAFIALRGRRRWAMICIVASALCIEFWAFPIMSRTVALQGFHGGLNWLKEPRAGLLLRTLLQAASLPAAFLIQPLDSAGNLGVPSAVLLVLPLFLNKRCPGLLLAGLWSLSVVGLVAGSDLWLSHGALSYIRYTLAASPMLFVIFAALSDLAGRWTRHALPALAVLGAMLAVPQVYEDQFWQKTESRLLAGDVRSHVQAGDVLVIVSKPDMGFYSAGEQYLALDFYAGPMPYPVAVLEAPASGEVRNLIWSHHRVWLVETFCGADATEYIGHCQLSPVATTRYQCGRLYEATLPKKS